MTVNIDKPIVLVGLMGAGKSTIGHRLAERLETEFVDIDEEIEKQEGKTISKIFEESGEEYFRTLEKDMIASYLDKEPHVMATGGGAFINEQTRKLIKEKALSVWLRANIDMLVERTSRNTNRPLLKQGDARQILQTLIDERYPIYAEADLIVESDQGPHYKIVDTIIWKL